jgi:hypothetical protein
VRVASGEDDDFAGFDRNRLFANDICEAPTFREDMIRDQMLGAGEDLRQQHFPRYRLGNPRRLSHDVEEGRPGEPYSFQDVR